MSGMAHPPNDYSAGAPLGERQASARRGPFGIDWGWWVAFAALALVVILGAVMLFGASDSDRTESVGTAAIPSAPPPS